MAKRFRIIRGRLYDAYDFNFITFDTKKANIPDTEYILHYTLNIKTLEIKFNRIHKSTNKKELKEVSICKVFNRFETVKRIQDELIRIILQERKKAKEVNKI